LVSLDEQFFNDGSAPIPPRKLARMPMSLTLINNTSIVNKRKQFKQHVVQQDKHITETESNTLHRSSYSVHC